MIVIEQMTIPYFLKQYERYINKLKEDYIQFKKYKKDYDGNLNEKNYQDVQITINNIVDIIIKEVNPVYNNKNGKANIYQAWILQTFAKQNKQGLQKFDENLYKYKNYLTRYITYLEEIKIDNTKNINTNGSKIIDTQINKYDTTFDLLDQLNKYEQKHSKQVNVSLYSNISDEIFELIKTGEIILVQELEKYMIFIPLSEQQQRLVGKDTEWCTQYQQRNTLFYNYNDSPLFTVRSKNVYKDNYQFYFPQVIDRNYETQQSKNNEDIEINFDNFKVYHPDIIDGFLNIFLNQFDEFYSKLKNSYKKFRINDKSKKLDWSIIKNRHIDNIYDIPEFIYSELCFEKLLTIVENDEIISDQLEYNMNNFKFISKNHNVNEELQIEQVSHDGHLIRYIINPSENVKLEQVKEQGYQIEYIKNPSDEIKLEQIKSNGLQIKFISNPSDTMNFAQVKNCGDQIQYIKDSSEEMKLEQVKNRGRQIRYISDPSDQIKLEQVKENGQQIEYIKDPSDQIKLEQVKNNGLQIEYIKYPSDQIKLEQIKCNSMQIQYIKDPSEELQLQQINNDGKQIEYISNPSENIKLQQILQTKYQLPYISNPSENLQLQQVTIDGQQLEFISNSSEKVQLVQVNQNGNQIKYISHPSEEVQIKQVKNDCNQIKHILEVSKQVIIYAISYFQTIYSDSQPELIDTESIQSIIQSKNFTIDMQKQIENNSKFKNYFMQILKRYDPQMFNQYNLQKEQKSHLCKLLQI